MQNGNLQLALEGMTVSLDLRFSFTLAVFNSISIPGIAVSHSVFGRITPDQKRELVDGLRRRGRYVAMIGDGVNDVPAMKAAV